MRKLSVWCCVAVLASAGIAAPETAPDSNPAAANAPQAAVQGADDKPRPALEKKICRSLEVGFSHRTERVCMTPKQWEEYNRGGD